MDILIYLVHHWQSGLGALKLEILLLNLNSSETADHSGTILRAPSPSSLDESPPPSVRPRGTTPPAATPAPTRRDVNADLPVGRTTPA